MAAQYLARCWARHDSPSPAHPDALQQLGIQGVAGRSYRTWHGIQPRELPPPLLLLLLLQPVGELATGLACTSHTSASLGPPPHSQTTGSLLSLN